tara:strand:- start:936 stop:1568 length:633 start_codon:yes stop_codon:yes gene_type:complete
MAIQDEINNLKTNISALSSNETQPMPSGMKQDNAEIIAVLTEAIAKETNPEAKAELRKRLQLYQMTQKLKDQMQQQPAPQQTMFKPNSIEENIAAIQANMDRETQISPERKAFIDGRQEIIDEVLMPLANAGYKDLVDTILTKPLESDAHNQAAAMLAKVMQQEDPEFEMQDFDMMIKSVSREPRPADLINPEGLPDAPPQAPEGISGLQ